MTASTIDLDALNSLFDNQKKLDDIFSSIFDEDISLSSPLSFNDYSAEKNKQRSSQYIHSNEELSFNTGSKIFVQKKPSIPYFVIPVIIEIAALYYGIMYLT